MDRPLVLVIRENDRFSEKLREAGCRVVDLPLIKTEVLADLSDLTSKLAKLEAYDGLFFTSPVAAEVLVAKISEHGFRGKVYALGERARAVFEDAGITVEKDGEANTAGELIDFFGPDEFAGKTLLFVRGERSMRTIPARLSGVAQVDEVIVYRTIESSLNEKDLRVGGEIDWICFFSPSGVEAFSKKFGSQKLNGSRAAAIGPTTAEAAARAGFNVGFISGTANAEDFANGLIGHIKSFE